MNDEHPDLVADLEARGLIHDSTDIDELRQHIAAGPVGIYYGCDPTADSLHVGNLIGLIMLRRFQDAGHRAIPLAGGATGMVGDPSGRSDERNLLDDDVLDHNVASIKRQLAHVIDLSDEGRGVLVDNREWTEPLSVLDFLRDVGKHVTVNQMLARESVKMRLESERGISFTEFSYMLLQANDYLQLFDRYHCTIQIGGSDQWGNILSGVDLIRRTRRTTVHAFSWPLLTASDGSKLGKTTGARVWLSAERTSPYQFRQHWMQISDEAIGPQLKTFSLRPLAEIDALLAEHAEAPQRRLAQQALANEMVALVHGEDAAARAAEAAELLFAKDPTGASVEAFEVLRDEIETRDVTTDDLVDAAPLFVAAGLTDSNSDTRRQIAQGALSVNGVALTADSDLRAIAPLHGRFFMLRRGKKRYALAELRA
ncbi:MAG: tyrosine--tRNA ligase [Actinomycetota bacterium]